MKFSKKTLIKMLKTFVQTALGYLTVNLAMIDFSAGREVVKTAATGLLVSAVSAGAAAVMNLEKKEKEE